MHVGNHFLISVGGMKNGAALQFENDYIKFHYYMYIHYLPRWKPVGTCSTYVDDTCNQIPLLLN